MSFCGIWRTESTLMGSQIFTDHQALKTFMENKELTRRQARYLDILSEYDFQIIFRAGKNNSKADALTRMPRDEAPGKNPQIILTPDEVDIRVGEAEVSLFARIHTANKEDELCAEFRQAIAQGLLLATPSILWEHLGNHISPRQTLMYLQKKWVYQKMWEKKHHRSRMSRRLKKQKSKRYFQMALRYTQIQVPIQHTLLGDVALLESEGE